MSGVWASLWLSLEIAVVATAVTCVVMVPLAYWMARARFFGKALAEAAIMMPLVLPPTVVGYVILLVLGRRGWLGGWLLATFDYSVVFRFEGAVIAAAVVAMPMMYMPAKAAFLGVDRDLEDAGRLAGAKGAGLFWRISLPLAGRGVMGGIVLAFARALGEFGATVMVYGWQPGRVTLPISVYAAYERGEMGSAGAAVVVLGVMSLGLMMGYNFFSRVR